MQCSPNVCFDSTRDCSVRSRASPNPTLISVVEMSMTSMSRFPRVAQHPTVPSRRGRHDPMREATESVAESGGSAASRQGRPAVEHP